MDSPFQSVLNTNYAPSLEEITEIREFCTKPEQEIQTLDAEISRFQEMISTLHSKREKLQETLDAHLALLSPIRRLSPELLQQIFAWCLPSDRNPIMHSSEAPLLLGRVCIGWRRIVYETAELWAAIHVVIPSSENAMQSPIRCEAMKEWLDRSGECPLSISIYAHCPPGDTSSILDALIPFCRRWRSLKMEITIEWAIRLCTIVSGNVPLLRDFVFESATDDQWPHTPSVHPSDANANYADKLLQFMFLHEIRHFGLTMYHVGPSATGLLLPPTPSLLETFSIDLSPVMFHDTTQLLDLLSVLPNLRQCTIKCAVSMVLPGTHGFSVLSIRQRPVVLNKLEQLAIMVTPSTISPHYLQQKENIPLIHIFDNLLVPGLSDMDFLADSDTGDTFKSIFNSFASMVERSSAVITKLTIRRNTKCLARSLEACLEQCPQVAELVIDRMNDGWTPIPYQNEQQDDLMPVGDKVLHVLMRHAYDEEATPLCPTLRTLTLIRFPPSILSDTTLREFLSVRSEMPAPLEHLYLRAREARYQFGPPMTPRIEELELYSEEFDSELEKLRSKGMTISIEPSLTTRYFTRSSPWLGLPAPTVENVLGLTNPG